MSTSTLTAPFSISRINSDPSALTYLLVPFCHGFVDNPAHMHLQPIVTIATKCAHMDVPLVV